MEKYVGDPTRRSAVILEQLNGSFSVTNSDNELQICPTIFVCVMGLMKKRFCLDTIFFIK